MGRLCSPVSCVCYFFIYSFIVGMLFFLLRFIEFRNFRRLGKGFRVFEIKFLRFLVLLLVSLAGLPPTVGFAIKWSIFVGVLPGYYLVLLFLVLGSLISLYYYLCVVFR